MQYHKYFFACLMFAVFFMLSACSSVTPLDPKKPVTINLWHYYSDYMQATMDKQIDLFNNTVGRELGIIVYTESITDSKKIHEKIMTALENNPGSPKLPDISMAYPNTAVILSEHNKLANLEEYFSQEELSHYIDRFIEEGRVGKDRKFVVFPITKSTEVLFLNETLYLEFINDYNKNNPAQKLTMQDLATFEGIRKTAEAYYAWTAAQTPAIPGSGKPFFGIDAPGNFADIAFAQQGKRLFDEEKGLINLDRDIFSLIWEQYVAPVAKGYYKNYSKYGADELKVGGVIANIGSTAGINFYSETVTFPDNTKKHVKITILPYPVLSGGKKAVVQRGAGMVVMKTNKEKEYAAAVFLKWLTRPENNIAFVKEIGYLPVTKEAIANLPQIIGNMSPEENIFKLLTCLNDNYTQYEYHTNRAFAKTAAMQTVFSKLLITSADELHKKKLPADEQAMLHFLERVRYEISRIR